ncbi:MAG: CAP domain-containing protein [Novosphingobium sp.]
MGQRLEWMAAALALAASAAVQAQQHAPREAWSGRAADRRNLAARLLAAHNGERSAVGMPALSWSPKLAEDARAWGAELARSGRFRHSSWESRKGQGENLFMGTAGAYAAEEMIGYFIGEGRDFRPGAFPEVSRTGRWQDVGHYTQLIWPETREVGCAIVGGGGQDYLVCRYFPTGNVVGQRVG